MDWLNKKKEKKKRVLLCKERGAELLEDVIRCCDGKSNPIKFFSADLILKATHNFSNSNRVSEIPSSFWDWDWYSGINDDHRMIIIKKNTYFDSSFCRDVAISSMVSNHKNFMNLVGCCLELEDPIMVYYGDKKLYSSINLENIVSWKRRMKIAEDIATALAYLHTAFSTPFVYRCMCIENILIDEDGIAKLSDFSSCISIPLGETYVKVDGVRGTMDYIDPDYLINSIVSKKTDAYGFGICMLLLLIGGRERFRESVIGGEHWMAPEVVSEFIEKDRLIDEIADQNMLEDMGEVTEEERCRMNAFLSLSVRCLGLKGEVPAMVEVAKELKKIQRSSLNASSSSSSKGIAKMYYLPEI